MAKRFEVSVFIETNIPTQTQLWVDYEISQALPERFQSYTDLLDSHMTQREVLFFSDELTHFGEYVRDYDSVKYLMEADDEMIIQNYRLVFTSSLAEGLPAPMFKSDDN